MKVTELKDKIIIAELEPDKDYVVLVNPAIVRMETLEMAMNQNGKLRTVPVVVCQDVNKAVKFIETPKETT